MKEVLVIEKNLLRNEKQKNYKEKIHIKNQRRLLLESLLENLIILLLFVVIFLYKGISKVYVRLSDESVVRFSLIILSNKFILSCVKSS